MLPAIIGSNLEEFVTGEIQKPAKMIQESVGEGSSSKTVTKVNPDYQLWRRIDQALLGWMMCSISPEVHNQISKPLTSF